MRTIGLVGCGFIGRVHAHAIGALSRAGLVDARLTAVVDADGERAGAFAGEHGAEVASGVEELVEGCEAVWVCTPTAGHLRVVEAAASAGRAVFCEKPLGRDLAEAQAVATALEGVPHQVGLVLRSAPVFRALAGHLDGRHGRVMGAVLRDDQYFPVGGMYGSSWRADAVQAGSGVLLEHSIHDLDLLHWLLGPADTVSCRTAAFAGHPGVEDAATCHLTLPSGATATLVSLWHGVGTRPSTRRLEVFCERALLWTDDDHLGPLHVETTDGEALDAGPVPPWIDDLAVPAEFRAPLAQYAAPAKDFLDALDAGHVPVPTAGDALVAHAWCDAAYRSARQEGTPVGLGT